MTRSDAITRRQLIKAGLILAGVPFCPEALFDRAPPRMARRLTPQSGGARSSRGSTA